MSHRRRRAAAIRSLLDEEGEAVFEAATHFNAERYAVLEGFDRYEALRDEARAVKEDAIERLPELVERVRESVEANGGHVHLAETASVANRVIVDVLEEAGADSVVKSKSMTTEELGTNGALEAAGIEVTETDLGEFVIQVADEAPSHLIAPGMHKSRARIAELFNETFDPDPPLETAEELTRFARDHLGVKIRSADAGITGANFVLADSGSIVLVTNEGNARKCAVTPDFHVAVAGVEKLIPSIDDLGAFVELIAKAGTGQAIANYVSILTPPVESPRIDFASDAPIGDGADDREFHLVLVDNGRLDMREDDDLRETLYCIRCGACANSCANFQHVGGHAFGGETYTGGIATGWEAGLRGVGAAADFNDLCTGCTRCVDACPVKIDIPWINTVVRDRLNREAVPGRFDFLAQGLRPAGEPAGTDLQKRLFASLGSLAALGSATAPVSNWLADRATVRRLLERFAGIDRRRDLPRWSRETLVGWAGDRRDPDPAAVDVVVYPDVYTNYVHPERGKAAVRTLEALGVRVGVPAVPESGRAPLSQGLIGSARRAAESVVGALEPALEAGVPVVVIEPTDLAMFRREYARLVPDEADRVAAAAVDCFEYVAARLGDGAEAPGLRRVDGAPVAYHSHCQQRTLGVEAYTEAVLAELGWDVTTSNVECCGMAGSFGYKTEYYELSVDVGEPLAEAFADADRIVASGTSCLEQLEDLLDRPVDHPIELVDPGR